MLNAGSTFQYFAAAAPGAKELVSLVKLYGLCEGPRKSKGPEPYDLVVLDAPATGHALAMLRSPQTLAAIVPVGPLAEQAQRVHELLRDPARTGYIAVAQATEMAVSETLELEEGLRMGLDRDLDAIVVNGTMPRRFSRQELERIALAAETHSATEKSEQGQSDHVEPTGHDVRYVEDGQAPKAPQAMREARLLDAAAHTAWAVYEHARVQRSQIARLRRQRFVGDEPAAVLTIPFAFMSEIDLVAIDEIAARLARTL
jgi:anion-transporting  ArsA/GET3 family ATPase